MKVLRSSTSPPAPSRECPKGEIESGECESLESFQWRDHEVGMNKTTFRNNPLMQKKNRNPAGVDPLGKYDRSSPTNKTPEHVPTVSGQGIDH